MLGNLLTSLYLTAIYAVCILGFVIVSLRFFKSMFTHEGYFTHTIPVESSTLLHVKLITGFCFMLVLALTVIASVIIVSAGTEFNVVYELVKLIESSIRVGRGVDVVIVTVELISLCILAILAAMLHVYAACAIGQRMKSKIGGAIMWFFIIYGIMQAANAVLMIGLTMVAASGITPSYHAVLLVYEAFLLSVVVTYYLITRLRLKNKLNLE